MSRTSPGASKSQAQIASWRESAHDNIRYVIFLSSQVKTKVAPSITIPATHLVVTALKSIDVQLPVSAKVSWWLWPHVFSLDAPLVALGWQIWWARVAGINLPWRHHLILGLAVWLVYLADRWADALRTDPLAPVAERHAFARRHGQVICFLLMLNIASLGALSLSCLSGYQFADGMILLLTVGLYFLFTHRRPRGWLLPLPKEAMVGILFAAGTSFFVWCAIPRMMWRLTAEMCLFGGICFLNCALITRWEHHRQDLHDPWSILNAYPRLVLALKPVCLMMALAAVGIGAIPSQSSNADFLPLLLGSAGLWALDHYQRNFSKPQLRVLADIVLLGPWLCLWLV